MSFDGLAIPPDDALPTFHYEEEDFLQWWDRWKVSFIAIYYRYRIMSYPTSSTIPKE